MKSTFVSLALKSDNACSISGVCRCVSNPYGVIFSSTAQKVVLSLGGLPALTPVIKLTTIDVLSITCSFKKGARERIEACVTSGGCYRLSSSNLVSE